MILSGNHNQFPSSFATPIDILKAFMFLSNLNDFNSSPLPSDQGFAKSKGSSNRCGRKNALSDLVTFSLSLSFCYALLMCFAFLFSSQSSFMLCFVLTCFCFFVFSFTLFWFSLKKNWKKDQTIQKQCVFCVHWYLCTLDGHWNKVF